MGSLDYIEFSKEETLDHVLKNNKGIIEIAMEDRYEESDYNETNHMIGSSSISLGSLQRDEFKVDNESEEVKWDMVLPII